MNVQFINRNKSFGFSFSKVFNPIEKEVEKTFEVLSIDVPEIRTLPWHSLRNVWYVFRHRNKEAIHHVTGRPDLAIGVWKQKTILTIHDANSIYRSKNIFQKYYLILTRLYLPIKASNIVTCISDSTRLEILKYVKCSPIVIPNPIDPSFCYYPKQFYKDKPVILHIGTGWNKNLKNTIKALVGIKCHLRIIGKVSEDIKVYLAESSIEYSYSYNLTDDEILNEYRKCDIVNFPSLYEGFGMPIIEGQATGRIVVTSNIEPMIEVSGRAAYLVDPNDARDMHKAYISAINNDFLRTQLICKGLKNVERFNVKNVASKYMELYRML